MKYCIAFLFFLGCSAPDLPDLPEYEASRLANVTDYVVLPTRATPGGVAVDDPRGEVDDALLDALVARVARCLATVPAPTPEQAATMQCLLFRRDVVPRGFDVLLAPDWYPAFADPREQVFPCSIDPAACEAKGLHPTPEHPCACRATVQDNQHVIVTPNLKLFPAELVRLVTGCNMVWAIPLAECAAAP